MSVISKALSNRKSDNYNIKDLGIVKWIDLRNYENYDSMRRSGHFHYTELQRKSGSQYVQGQKSEESLSFIKTSLISYYNEC